MHYPDIVETIIKRRETFQVTQEDLAKLSGVGLRTIKQIESGRGNPTLATIRKLGDALGMELVFRIKELTDEAS